MVTATARNPVQDQTTQAKAVETIKQFDAEVLGGDPVIESTTTIAPPADGASQLPATTAPAGAVSTVTEDPSVGFAGEWDESDLRFPTLAIVQGSSGPLIERFQVGTLVFGEDELFPAPKPNTSSPKLRVIPMQVQKSYRERISQEEYANGTMPRFAKTKREVLEFGGSLTWGPGGERPTWEPSAKLVFLIEGPAETQHPGFGIEIDNRVYAIGVYYAKGMSYGTTAKGLWNAYQTVLFVNRLDPATGMPLLVPGTARPQKDRLLWKSVWNWTWGTKKVGNFNPWYPNLRLTQEETTPAVREFITTVFAPSEAVHSDGE